MEGDVGNLHHAPTWNIIEHIFGVLKQQFLILIHPPKYNMDIQAHLPPALATLHNFICICDLDEIVDMLPLDDVDIEATSALTTELPGQAE